jgi:hypothetical protein
MKIQYLITGILLLLAGIPFANAASISGSTVSVTDPLDAAALVYVSGYEISPPMFFPGETGTVTVHVRNAANISVSVSDPDLIDPHVHLINSGAFATATSIGPGETVDYNFIFTADGTDGTYFPLFTVSTIIYGGHPINSQIKLKIDSTPVRASISSKPDTFSVSKKDSVNISVVNPRTANITNVLIIPKTDGAEISPKESFIGNIPAGGSVEVPFSVTPDMATDVTFTVSYNNGDNQHTTQTVLPLVLGENKKGAQIVVNNIETTADMGSSTIKGDVTNNGLTAARSVLVTVGSPATPVNPNPVYAIGNLEPDDFASFEVTYTQNGPGAIPLIVEFKDSDGNVFSERFTMDGNANSSSFGSAGMQGGGTGSSSGSAFNRRGAAGPFGSFGSGLNQVPIIPIAIVLVAFIVLIAAWRKGLLKKIAARLPKRRKEEPDDEIRDQ